MPDLSLPEALATRYQARDALGSGGFGQVLRAYDQELDRDVAVKVLHGFLGDAEAARFRAEAEALARLEHPGVVRVYDHGHDGEGAWIVMELLDGDSLDTSPPTDPLGTMLAAAEGLQAIHDAGLLHRDVKPGNILRTRGGRVVLVDLGLVLDQGRERLTRTGAVVGTPEYVAPEQLGGPEGDAASDWYSWGATLFWLLEDRPPFHPALVMVAAQGGELPDPTFEATDPASPAGRTITACLQLDPRARPSSLRELRRLAVPMQPSRPLATPSATSRLPWKPLAVGLLGLLGVAGWALWAPPEPPRDQGPPAPAAEAPATPQLAALRAAMDRLGASHRSEGGRYQVTMGPVAGHPQHAPAVQREYADGRIVGRYRRALEALEAWLAVADPTSIEEVVTAEVAPLWLHLYTDEAIAVAGMRTGTEGLVASELDREVVETRLRELEELRRSYLHLARHAPGLAGLELAMGLEDRRVAGQAPGRVEARLALAEAYPPGAERLRAAFAASSFLSFDLLADTRPACELRTRALELLGVGLRTAGPRAPPDLRARAGSAWIAAAVQNAGSCSDGLPPEELAALEAGIAAQHQLLRRAPALTAGPTRCYLEALVVYLEAGASVWLGRQPQLRELVGKIPGLVEAAREYEGVGPLPDDLVPRVPFSGLGSIR